MSLLSKLNFYVEKTGYLDAENLVEALGIKLNHVN